MVKQLVQHGANIEFVDHALRNALYWSVLTNTKLQFALHIWILGLELQLLLVKTVLYINQILAKWGTNSKFEAEANHKLLVPKSKTSSKLIYQIFVCTNAES